MKTKVTFTKINKKSRASLLSWLLALLGACTGPTGATTVQKSQVFSSNPACESLIEAGVHCLTGHEPIEENHLYEVSIGQSSWDSGTRRFPFPALLALVPPKGFGGPLVTMRVNADAEPVDVWYTPLQDDFAGSNGDTASTPLREAQWTHLFTTKRWRENFRTLVIGANSDETPHDSPHVPGPGVFALAVHGAPGDGNEGVSQDNSLKAAFTSPRGQMSSPRENNHRLRVYPANVDALLSWKEFAHNEVTESFFDFPEFETLNLDDPTPNPVVLGDGYDTGERVDHIIKNGVPFLQKAGDETGDETPDGQGS